MSSQFAKRHIRNRFAHMILPHVLDGLNSIYANAIASCKSEPELGLKTFQNLLTFIPNWDETRLLQEVDRISTASGCTYIEELMTATLLTYLRAFAEVQQSIEIEFEHPPLPRFVHETYKECARQCWSNAYLFKTNVSAEQQARNYLEIQKLLDASLDKVLDSFLPWKSIVEKYFQSPQKASPECIIPLESKSVKFEDSESEESDTEPEKLVFSDEPITFSVEEEVKPSESVELVPTEEIALAI